MTSRSKKVAQIMRLTALILSQGAHPNEPLGKSTVWGHFLLLLHERKRAGKDNRMSLATTRLLIEHGASATIDWRHYSHAPLKGDPYQRKEHMRPSDIIEECFPADAERRNALFRQQRRQERVGAEASVTKSSVYPINKNDEQSTRLNVTSNGNRIIASAVLQRCFLPMHLSKNPH